jgi:effector-binding domain-containing protein
MSDADLSKYQFLKEPKISTKSPMKVMAIEIVGDPSSTAGTAFSRLYKMKFKLKNDSLKDVSPRARWPNSVETPRAEYLGIFALPVSKEVDSIPYDADNPEPKIKLLTWEYGEVAEILHIGSYTKEPPTIEKLHNHISVNGFEILGMHEEEYLKGPGMFIKGNPDEYQTIIRYQVKKKGKKWN